MSEEAKDKGVEVVWNAMSDDDKYQFIFDKAKELCDDATKRLDELETATKDHQAVMSILGYAVSMLVQSQAVAMGNDRMMEMQNFAGYLVHITSMFQPTYERPVAEA